MDEGRSLRRLTPAERLRALFSEDSLSGGLELSFTAKHPPLALAEQWIENAIGYYSLPIGVVDHLIIDRVPRSIPLATEETSIIAASSACAKWIRQHGTITTESVGLESIGQIHFASIRDPVETLKRIAANASEILRLANECVPGLVRRGGGFTRIESRTLGSMFVLHLYCDTCDAMGANLINQACEIVAPSVARIIGEEVGLRILSNLTDTRRSRAKIHLSGIDPLLARRIEDASRFAEVDPYRAATHNKGIMNGIDGVVLATGNDWRAVEAGAHAYAARTGSYRPLSFWRSPREGELVGEIDLPIAIGTVGGVTRTHPTAAAALQLIGAKSAPELARIIAAVGLTQNLAALRALASNGIVAGHMRLHLTNLLLSSEATEREKPLLLVKLRDRLASEKRISESDVRVLLSEIRNGAEAG